jgi:quercetin dioxygenase-like cupin family protein
MFFTVDNVKYGEIDPKKMCGDGRIEIVKGAPQSPGLRAAYVKFEEGAHTKWHQHSGEQLLMGVEGSGFVELRGEPDIPLREGDRVFIPPNTWHRHGATKGEKVMVHLAVTYGKTQWDEEDPCDKHA